MVDVFAAAALLIIISIAGALAWLLRAPSGVDRMMVVQLAGTGGAAVALLLAKAEGVASLIDVALVVALLAAIASAGLTVAKSVDPRERL